MMIGNTVDQCQAQDDTWKSSAECGTSVLDDFKLIDKDLPIIDMFLNPAKRSGLKETEDRMRVLARTHFPSAEIGRNLTSLFNLLWNSNLPCFGGADNSGGFLLKKCFLYGEERDCRDLFRPVTTDSGICCAFNHRQRLRDSQYSRLLKMKQREEREERAGENSEGFQASVGVAKGLKVIMDQHSNLVTAGSVLTTSKYFINIKIIMIILTLFRSFKILIGSSDDTPTTFGTIQTVLPAGKEHFVQITPTLIRNSLYVSSERS